MSYADDVKLVKDAKAAECRIEARHDLDPFYTYEGNLMGVVCSRCGMGWRTVLTRELSNAETTTDAGAGADDGSK